MRSGGQRSHLRCPARRALSALVLAGLTAALMLPGCGDKTMTQADCDKVGEHIRQIWDNEVAATAPSDDSERSERAKNAIRGEGDRISKEWQSQCRRDIEGRRVDDKEIECILAAKTISGLQDCAAKK